MMNSVRFTGRDFSHPSYQEAVKAVRRKPNQAASILNTSKQAVILRDDPKGTHLSTFNRLFQQVMTRAQEATLDSSKNLENVLAAISTLGKDFMNPAKLKSQTELEQYARQFSVPAAARLDTIR